MRHFWHAHRRAILTCMFAMLIVAASAGLFSAAALAPAPPAVLPLVVIVCIGGPMLAAWELRTTLAPVIGTRRSNSRAIAALRRRLDQIPETKHPLGL